MLAIVKFAILLLASHFVAAGKSCRQCTGSEDITFTEDVTQAQALNYGWASIHGCLSGGDALSPKIDGYDCLSPSKCRRWVMQYVVWRYCGNGGAVFFTKRNLTFAGVTSVYDSFTFKCELSVKCGPDKCQGQCY